MASLLESQLRKAIAKGFKGKLLKGTLWRSGATTVNTLGDDVPATPQTFSFEGFREDYSQFYRAQTGIPDTDCKVVIIAGLCATTPSKDDKLQLRGQWFQIRRVRGDPAGATHECQCFETGAPS
jgi:hypothetical protein